MKDDEWLERSRDLIRRMEISKNAFSPTVSFTPEEYGSLRYVMFLNRRLSYLEQPEVNKVLSLVVSRTTEAWRESNQELVEEERRLLADHATVEDS